MSYRDNYKQVERDGIWTFPRVSLAVLLVVMFFYGLGFFMTGGDLAIYSFWAPKQANAENRVFHETQAYTDGKVTYIGRLCRESAGAEGSQKAAIDGEIVNEASTISVSKLPADEQSCVARAKGY